MDNRPRETLTLPSGIQVTIYTNLTGWENRQVQKKMFELLKLPVGKSQEETEAILRSSEVPMSIILEMQDVALEYLLVEIKDPSGAVLADKLQAWKNLSKVDSDALYIRTNEITKEVSLPEEVKKK